MRPRSRFDVPDQDSEHGEEHAHSPTFAAILTHAYEYLAQKAFDNVERVISTPTAWPIAYTQNVRRLFVLARVAHHREEYAKAAAFYEEAMALCEARNWLVEFARLAIWRAEAYHELQLFGPAADVAESGLDAWLVLRRGSEAVDISFETELRDRLSVEQFLLGEYESALQQTRAALRGVQTLPAAEQAALRAADLEWTIALLHRWRNDTRNARRQILSALKTYESLGSADALARLRIVVADIALDALIPLGSGIAYHYREDLVRLARTQLTLARDSIEEAGNSDQAGRCMCLLAQARLSRALGEDENRLALIESVGRVAERLHDLPLIGQVYTALGDEFGALGRTGKESQRNCYRRALGVIEASYAPAYGAWARRGLLHDAEIHLDVD